MIAKITIKISPRGKNIFCFLCLNKSNLPDCTWYEIFIHSESIHFTSHLSCEWDEKIIFTCFYFNSIKNPWWIAYLQSRIIQSVIFRISTHCTSLHCRLTTPLLHDYAILSTFISINHDISGRLQNPKARNVSKEGKTKSKKNPVHQIQDYTSSLKHSLFSRAVLKKHHFPHS